MRGCRERDAKTTDPFAQLGDPRLFDVYPVLVETVQ